MKSFFTTKRICRAGVIAALYVALTLSFGALSYNGFMQIRPAEALCILPLFLPEAIPALYIGCLLSNIFSLYGIADILLGPLATLIAALATYFVGKAIKNHLLRFLVGGLFPIFVNAFIVPLLIVFFAGDLGGQASQTIAYWFFFSSMAASQTLWIYGLGSILYFTLYKLDKRYALFQPTVK